MHDAERVKIFGDVGEAFVREWLKAAGYCVIPISLIDNGGAPMLEDYVRSNVLPDILCALRGLPLWVDVKSKARATKNRQRGRWETGCALRHFEHYCAVAARTGIPGALAFLHARESRLFLGALDDLTVGAAVFRGPFPPGHAFTEPMIFFDLDRFSWYVLEDSAGLRIVQDAASPAAVLRPWEVAIPKHRQPYIPGL